MWNDFGGLTMTPRRGDRLRESAEEIAVVATALAGRLAANARWLDQFEVISLNLQLAELRGELTRLVDAQPVLPRRRPEVV